MKRFNFAIAGVFLLITGMALFTGCNSGNSTSPKVGGVSTETPPVFSLAYSEYPSWSVFGVAAKAGLINPKEGGEPGTLEKKWGVDIVLHAKDYDPCLTMYTSGTVDAVCMTNMDALNPSLGRASTAILPTSTSEGGDKVIGANFSSGKLTNSALTNKQAVQDYLRGKKVYGLSKSVSEYAFVRGCEVLEVDSKSVQFVNLEPAAAATALQTGSNGVQVIMVWNPYALQTLRTQKDASVVFDSSLIPEEIIDMVVASNDSLKRDKGDAFASCICEVFYEVNKKLNNATTADATYKALGADFSNLGVEDMKQCCKDTRFYSTPALGINLFSNPKFKTTMGTVVSTCQKIDVIKQSPTLGYNDPAAQLNFSTKYMESVVK